MTTINQSIDVNSYYFAGDKQLRSFPKTIQYQNYRHTFTDGIRYLVIKGATTFKLFDMTDGKTIYRIRQDGDNWTLVSTK